MREGAIGNASGILLQCFVLQQNIALDTKTESRFVTIESVCLSPADSTGGNVLIGGSLVPSNLLVTTADETSGQSRAFALTNPTHNGGAPFLQSRTFGTGLPYNLELFEGGAFKPGGGAWAVVSDARVKKNVEVLHGSLDKLMKLRPVTFEYKNPGEGLQVAGRHVGLIAQEVEDVFPEWITETPEGYKAISVRGFEALTVQALHEIREEKDAALAAKDAKIAALETAQAKLEARLAKLEKLLEKAAE